MFMLSTFFAGRLERCQPPKKFETGNTREAAMIISAELGVREERGAA